MGFARQTVARRRHWVRLAAGPVERECVVDEPRGGIAQYRARILQRIHQVLKHYTIRQIGNEPLQRIANALANLAHDGGTRQPRQRVEGGQRAVAVGVDNLARLQNAIIESRKDGVPERVARLDWRQVMSIVADLRNISEDIAETQRQEEVPARISKLSWRVVARIRRKEHVTRGYPPVSVTVRGISTVAMQDRVGVAQLVAIDLSDQLRRQRQGIAFARQRQGFQLAEY